MAMDSYNNPCLTKIDQFIQENDQLPRCWRNQFVETHLRLLRVFACYTGKWSDEDKTKYLGYLPTDHLDLEALLNKLNLSDYVDRFVFPEASVEFENGPKLRFVGSYVSLNFQAKFATTLKYVLSFKTHPPVGDVLQLSQFVYSVEKYVSSLISELRAYFHLGDHVVELRNFRLFVSTLAEQSIDHRKLQNLLARAGALVLMVTIAACEIQMIDRDARDFVAQLEFHSANLLKIIEENVKEITGEVLRAYADSFEATKASSSRGQVICVVTFEDLVESYANLYQLIENQVNILCPMLDNLCSTPVVKLHFAEEFKLLWTNGFSTVATEVRSLIGSAPPNIGLSKLCYKLNLIKAEIFVLLLYRMKSFFQIPTDDDEVDIIISAFKSLSKYFRKPEKYMREIGKSILAHIEELLGDTAGGSLCDSHDQSQKYSHEDIISRSSLKILKFFQAAALLVHVDHGTSRRFLERYCLEILQKSLIFMRALLDQENTELSTIIGPVISEAIDFVFSFGGGDDKMEELLPDSFSRIIELNFVEITTVHRQCPWSLPSSFPKSDGPVFIDFLLKNVRESLEGNPSMTARLFKDEAQLLLEELMLLQSIIKYAKQKSNNNESEGREGERIIGLIYEAEYIITCLFEAAGVPLWYKQMILFNTIAEAKLIKSVIQKYYSHHLKEERCHGTILDVARETFKRSNSNSSTDDVIVGLKDRAKDIEDRLTNGSPKLQVVSIVGMGGIGKTTLVKKVYNSPAIQHHFRDRAWCTVSQVYHKRELLLQILVCITGISKIEEMTDDDVANTLRRSFKRKRYLVVMDDLWSLEPWKDLQMSLPDDGMGSRILFTSRNSEVCVDREPYCLPFLTFEESWILFKQKCSCPEELLGVGSLIVENCKGLPLAIVVMAALLEKVEKRKYQWEEIAQHMMSHLAHDDGDSQIMLILELSYNHLPSHLKPCFLYFGMFLEDQQVPVQKLKWLWIAEGFVPKTDSKSLEETAEEYLVELIGRNLVMEAQRRSRGGVKTCQMHDMVRYLCLEKAREQNFMQRITKADGDDLDDTSSSYRLCFQPNMEEHRVPFKLVGPHVRSLMVLPRKQSTAVHFELKESQNLRVMDIKCTRIAARFFEELEVMRCLKYLALRGKFSTVPSRIVELFNLETLILKTDLSRYESDGINVPTELWIMRKLRHVSIDFISHSSLPDPDEISNLENIVTLSFLTFGRSSRPGQTFLSKLIGLKELKCQFGGRNGADIEKNYVFPAMDALYQLESLHLCRFRISPIVFLLCNFRFPPNLKKLTLSRFELPWESTSGIGQQFCNLEVLKLTDCYQLDSTTWNVAEGEFPNLKCLMINYNFCFKNWNASSDSFPSLERLVLQGCTELVEIPISFGEIPTLQMIEMNDCSESANKSALRIYEQQLEYGNEEFKVLITRR